MLSKEFVLAILQASITSAGLVLAVYTLILPLSRKLLSYRAKETVDKVETLKKELKEKTRKIGETSEKLIKGKVQETEVRGLREDISRLSSILASIEISGFPTYLKVGAGLTFFGYIVSALMSFFWMLDVRRTETDIWLPFVFVCSTILFLIVGLLGIKDVGETMTKLYEELKRKVEKVKTEALPERPRVAVET
jgi:predicted PurR-regulated permease PerM